MGAGTSNAIKLSRGTLALLVFAGLFSVGWIAGAIAMALGAFGGAAPTTYSEWGDFTAGAFAPLAFLWLLVAVILQSSELREQRKELALTRGEMRHQRKVLNAQALEAEKQAQFIGVQTRILRRQDRHRLRLMDEEEFDRLVIELEQFLIHAIYGPILFILVLPDGKRQGCKILTNEYVAFTQEKAVPSYVDRLEKWLGKVGVERVALLNPPTKSKHDVVLKIALRLKELEEKMPGRPRLATFTRLRIDELLHFVQRIEKLPLDTP